MNWFPNVGTDSWAMGITTPPVYDGKELYDKSVGPKIAHVDTASLNIVVPEAEFTTLLQAMRIADPTITTYQEDRWLGNIMKSSNSCEGLAPLLSNFKIPLNRASVIMKPKAFLYSFHGENDCLIAIEQGNSDEYRLGTLFLRHLYLGLDFRHNDIVLGQNPATDDIYFDGKALDPYNNAPTLITIMVVVFVVLVVGGVYWYNQKCAKVEKARPADDKKQTLVTAKGKDEVKTGINDSRVDSDDDAPAVLDKEAESLAS